MKIRRTISQKLQYTLVYLTLVVTLILLLLVFLCYFFQIKRNSRYEGISINEINANILQLNVDSIYSSFIYYFGTEEFLSDLNYMIENTSYDAIRYGFQNELQQFVDTNPLIHSAFILDPKTSSLYSEYKYNIRVPSDQILGKDDMAKIDGVTWLSDRLDPISNNHNAIYLVFPIVVAGYANLATSAEDVDAYLITLVDGPLLESFLTTKGELANKHFSFIFDSNGTLVLGSNQDVDIALIQQHLQEQEYENFSTYLSIRYLSVRGLYIVDYVDKLAKLKDFMTDIVIMYLCIIATLFITMFIIDKFIKKNISIPIERLAGGVQRVTSGDYSHLVEIDNHGDELTVLANSFNLMSIRILEQMDAIRSNEQEQYRIKMKLLTEQLNPHFIYNTLECIRHSVSSSSAAEADALIVYLSTYLRTALAHGADVVPISNEIKHILSYVRIMEKRFDQPIQFTIDGVKGIENCLILKSMFQPIIENSIKHGFNIDSSFTSMQNPSIELRFRRENDKIITEICDNGSGFDPDRIMSIIDGKLECGQHFGLGNTYRRMQIFYGEENVDIKVSSIPYYLNIFTITVPFLGEQD